MVEAVRRGRSHHDVAREFHVSPSTVHRWVQPRPRPAPGPSRLVRSVAQSRTPPSGPRPRSRTWSWRCAANCRTTSDLGFHGAEAIRQALRSPRDRVAPRGADHQPHPPPARRPGRPAAGPTATAAAGLVSAGGRGPAQPELDSVDVVEGLVIKGGPQVEVLNAVSLHGGLVASWPRRGERHGEVRGRVPGRALAAVRPAGLRPVRQRHDLPGAPRPPRRRRAGQPAVPGPGGGPGVRPAARAGLPGGHRELQRLLAGEGLGPVRARGPGAAWPIGPVATSPRCGVTVPIGSRRRRHGGRSRSAGAWTSRPGSRAGWST